jgi:beta-glucosidase
MATPATVSFPDGFRWGTATAAYQVEGAASADGRGESIWDTFARTPGNVHNGHTGDVACDHYHRYPDDVALMAELGIGTYRLSLSWPRILPSGHGPANPAGLDFYDRLLDRLAAHGIAPMVTLYHWDLPQALEGRGGWPDREVPARFAEYAATAVARFGDRVATWTTLNEPWCSAFLGYGNGEHAPGRRDPRAAFRAAHHLLLGHGLAAQALRAGGAREVSITLNLTRVDRRDPDDPADARAARVIDGLHNRLWLDALLRGAYPDDVLDLFHRFGAADAIRPGDLDIVSAPLDLLGINYYSPTLVAAVPGQPAIGAYPGSDGVATLTPELPVTDMGWPVDASGLRDLLMRVTRQYAAPPLLVTENGAAYPDRVVAGRVRDQQRIAFLDQHLRAAHEAIGMGADLRGYLAWSLMDNFEWAYGYSKRFGLVHVDYTTQRRTAKDSALWYRDVIRRNGLP